VFIGGDGGVFDQCEGAETDALEEQSATCFWGEYYVCGIFELFSLSVKESEWFLEKLWARGS
jgi:hypothetical protein